MPSQLNYVQPTYDDPKLYISEKEPQTDGPLTLPELQAKVDAWLSGEPLPEGLFSHPLGNFDVYEDAQQLVNRIYYTVHQFSSTRRHLKLFVFYEEVTFHEDEYGDLVQVKSEYFVPEE